MGRSNKTKRRLLGGSYKPDGKCCIRACGRPIWGHELCRSHYQAWRNNGHPLHFLKRRVPSSTAKTSTREYKSWHGAKLRCTSPKSRQYPNYGGRGIAMCQRWRDSFDAFLADMGRCPSRHTLERKDVNGDYEPGNCRWATTQEQNRNLRSTRLSPQLVAEARAKVLAGKQPMEVAKEYGDLKGAMYQALIGNSWVDVQPAGNA